jgi:4-diphosphocytidyl-2-C-methyl-D-erythritol kinase
LQEAAQSHCGEVEMALNWLKQHVGPARMSGSGSAVFASAEGNLGIDGSSADLQQALAALPKDWKVRWCRGLDQHPLRDWCSG